MRRLYLILGMLVGGLLVASARAETFKLSNGAELSGEMMLSTANETGVKLKAADGTYPVMSWADLSQEDIRRFAKNPKLFPYVEPYIEVSQEEKLKQTEVTIKPVTRLERPARGSLFGAFFSSGVGLFIVFLIYAANVFAGYEVAIFRAQPPLLVAGLAAIPLLGFLSPIIFICIPTQLKSAEEAAGVPAEGAVAEGTAEGVNPMHVEGAEHPGSLHVTHTPVEDAKPALPPSTTYPRGQYTFNRRFFETKFPGFFSVVKRESDRDMVLVFKSARGEHVGQRISRIAANDLHLQVQKGHASEEIQIPFAEIQEVRLQHKDAGEHK